MGEAEEDRLNNRLSNAAEEKVAKTQIQFENPKENLQQKAESLEKEEVFHWLYRNS